MPPKTKEQKAKSKKHTYPGRSVKKQLAVPAAIVVLDAELPGDRIRAKFHIPRWARDAAKVIAAERNAKGNKTTMEKTLGDFVAERIAELRPDLVPASV